MPSGPAITGASWAGGTMAVTSLTLDSGSLWVDFAGQTGGEATFLLSAVPEPETYAPLGLGLLGVAVAARRRLGVAA